MKKLSEKIKTKALILYKSGMSQRAVGQELSIGVKTVQRWAKLAGISHPTNKSRIAKGAREKAIRLYKNGIEVKDIASQLGFSVRTFYVWTKGTNLVSRSRFGKRNPMWKGGITPIKEIVRSSCAMRKWRLAVFERDGFTCSGCRQVGGYLEAHHILAFSKYPKERFNVNNGITLCIDCHMEIHNRKRKVNKVS